MDVTGKHLVVTGAAGGIGLALAQRFHRAGARVVLADLDGARAERAAAELDAVRPGSALGVRADVGSEAGNVALIKTAQESFGSIDLFFANAGVMGANDVDSPEDEWSLAFAVNIHAHRWAAKHLLPGWLARGDGYFCCTASAAGLVTQLGSVGYSVTKHAAVAFAEWLSVTYGDRGLRVSCLCPQAVNTAMLRSVERSDHDTIANVVKSSGALLEPAQVADVVLDAIAAEQFLVTPHPEALTYWARKATDNARWLAGMRRLQRTLES